MKKVLALVLLLALSDCCDCLPQGFALVAPCESARAQVADVVLAGSCSDARIEPTPLGYRVSPKRAGPCHVSVLFKDATTFEKDVAIEQTTGSCCPGLYAEGGAYQIALPGSCADAGT